MLDWQSHKKLRIFIKVICVTLIISFLSYDLSWAGATEVLKPVNRSTSQKAQLPASIQIPSELGTIKDYYASKYNPDKLVIYIQDAHANIKAQENEANLIKYLKDKYQINQACVEGGFGEFDAGFFRSFPKDKPVREKIAQYFLSKSFISGPDYLLITEDKPPIISGAEDKALYTSHLNIFKQNQPIVERFNLSLDKFQGVLGTLKTKYYSQDLKGMDAKVNAFKENKLSLTEYLSYLNNIAVASQFNLAKYPDVSGFLKLYEFEQKINFSKAETERKALIEQLTKVLARNDLEDFVKKSLDFKTNKVDPSQYYAYLEEVALKANLPFQKYPNLLTYIKYIALSESIDTQKLSTEIEQFTKDLKAKLATSQAQKDIDSLTYILYILKGLADISLSPEEYEYFRQNRQEFSPQRIAQLLNPYIQINPLPTDADIASLESFYCFAHERDKAMVSNSLNRLSQETKAVILVAGGFHFPGITSILKEKDISYLVVTPNIKTNHDTESVYFSLLKDKKLPLEEVLNEPDTLQLVNSISDSETRQRLILYWVARASRYYPLKELKTQLNKLKLSEEDKRATNLALKDIRAPASHVRHNTVSSQEGKISNGASHGAEAKEINNNGFFKRVFGFINTHLKTFVVISALLFVLVFPQAAQAAKFELRPGPQPNQQQVVAIVEPKDTLWDIAGTAYKDKAGPGAYASQSEWPKIYQANPQIQGRAGEQLGPQYPDTKQIVIIQNQDELNIPGDVNLEATGLSAQIQAQTQKIEAQRSQSQDELNQAQKNKKNLQKEIQQLKEDKDNLKKDIHEIKDQIKQLKQILEELKKKSAPGLGGWWDSQSALSKIGIVGGVIFGLAAFLGLGMLIAKLSRFARLREMIDKANARLIELEKNLEALGKEKADKKELIQLKEELEAIKSKTRVTTQEPDKKKARALAVEQKLAENIKALEAKKQKEKQDLDNLRLEKQKLQAEIDALAQEKEKLKTQLAKEEAALKETINQLEAQVASAEEQRKAALTEEGAALEEEFKLKRKEIAAQIEKLHKELARNQEKLEALKTKAQEKETVLGPLSSQVEELRQKYADLQSAVKGLEAKKIELEKTLQRLELTKKEISQLEKEKAAISLEVRELEEKKKEAQETIKKTEETTRIVLPQKANALLSGIAPWPDSQIHEAVINQIKSMGIKGIAISQLPIRGYPEHKNIVVKIPASQPKYEHLPKIILNAHLDTARNSGYGLIFKDEKSFMETGALDDRVGIAAILQALRILKEKVINKHAEHGPIWIIFTDLEEPPYDSAGARDLSDNHRDLFENTHLAITVDGPLVWPPDKNMPIENINPFVIAGTYDRSDIRFKAIENAFSDVGYPVFSVPHYSSNDGTGDHHIFRKIKDGKLNRNLLAINIRAPHIGHHDKSETTSIEKFLLPAAQWMVQSVVRLSQDLINEQPIKLEPIELPAAPKPYAGMIFDVDNTITEIAADIDRDMLGQILYFLKKGVNIALVTAQGIDEVKKYILDKVSGKDKAWLRNLVIYPCAGVQAYQSDKEGNLKLLYDTSQDTILSDNHKEVVELIHSIAPEAHFHYRGGIITVSRISDRDQVIRELIPAFEKKKWPLVPRVAGKKSTHILIHGSDKGQAASHFFNEELKKKFAGSISQKQLLIVGDSFYAGGLDLDMAYVLPGADIVSVGKKPKDDSLRDLQIRRIKFSEDLVGARNQSATKKILSYVEEGKNIHEIKQNSSGRWPLNKPPFMSIFMFGVGLSLFLSLVSPLKAQSMHNYSKPPVQKTVLVAQAPQSSYLAYESLPSEETRNLIEILTPQNYQDVYPYTLVDAIEELDNTTDPAAIEKLVWALTYYYEEDGEFYSSSDIRDAAKQALIKIGEPAVNLLIASITPELYQENSEAVIDVIKILRKIKDSRAIDKLSWILDYSWEEEDDSGEMTTYFSAEIQREAVKALISLGEEGVQVLVDEHYLPSLPFIANNGSVDSEVDDIITYIDKNKVVNAGLAEQLALMYSDSSLEIWETTRETILKSLIRMGDVSIAPLVEVLNSADVDDAHKEEIADALKKIGNEPALTKILVKKLEKSFLNFEDYEYTELLRDIYKDKPFAQKARMYLLTYAVDLQRIIIGGIILAGVLWKSIRYFRHRKIRLIYTHLAICLGEPALKERRNLLEVAKFLAKKDDFNKDNIFSRLAQHLPEMPDTLKKGRVKDLTDFVANLKKADINAVSVLRYGAAFVAKTAKTDNEFREGLSTLEEICKELKRQNYSNYNIDNIVDNGSTSIITLSEDIASLKAFSNFAIELTKKKRNPQEILAQISPWVTKAAKDANQVASRLNIILKMVLEDVLPTQLLIETAAKTTSQGELKNLIAGWKKTIADFKTGALHFDPKNPLHVDLEYTTYKKLFNQVSQSSSYESYLEIIRKFQAKTTASNLGKQEMAEVKFAVYEAFRTLDFIIGVKQKADQLGRPVWVVPNLSYGKFAVSPILDDLAKLGVEIHYVKVGSGDCHDKPYFTKPSLFSDEEYRRILKEKPVIVVVDGTQHLISRPEEKKSARYPDAYIGYRNLAVAINDALTNKKESVFLDKVRITEDFLTGLRNTSEYQELVKKLKRLKPNSDDSLLYALEFWNPAGLRLVLREARKEVRNVSNFRPHNLKVPALIFINGVMLDKNIPKEIKAWAKPDAEHKPAYFDDNNNIKSTIFAVNGRGIYLSHALEYEITQAVQEFNSIYKDKLPKIPESPLPSPELIVPRYEAMLFDLDGTLTDTLSEIDESLLDKLIHFLSLGVVIGIVTSQSLDEVKKYVLDKVESDKNPALEPLIVFTARGAQAWGFDRNKNAYSIYDRAQTDLNEQQKQLICKLVNQALGSLAETAEITDRQAQITIRLKKNKDKRDLVNATLNQLIANHNLPFQTEYSGNSTIHIVMRGIDKGTAKDYFLKQIIPQRLNHPADAAKLLVVGDRFEAGGSDRPMIVEGARVVSVGGKDKDLPKGVEAYPHHGWEGTDKLLEDIIDRPGGSTVTLPGIFFGLFGFSDLWLSISDALQGAYDSAKTPLLYFAVATLGLSIFLLVISSSIKYYKTYRIYSQIKPALTFLKAKDKRVIFMEISRQISRKKIRNVDPYQLLIDILPFASEQVDNELVSELADAAGRLKNAKINPRHVFKYVLVPISAKAPDEKSFLNSLRIAERFASSLYDKRYDYHRLLKEIMPALNKTARNIDELNEALLLGITLANSGRNPAIVLTKILPEVTALTKTYAEFKLGIYALQELCLQGFEPTRYLLAELIKLKKQEKINQALVDWQKIRRKFKTGEIPFNPKDKLHVNLEYTTFRELVDRNLKQLHKYSFREYQDILKNFNQKDKRAHVKRTEKAEIKFAAYEAFRFREFALGVKKQADKMGKKVWVVPNLSYGRFAVSPILKDLASDGVEIHYARIGSSESHDNPKLVKADLFSPALYDRIINEQPIIIVVDGTQHLLARPKDRKSARYPDAYVGYRNLIIAVNDVLTNGREELFKDLVKTRGRFIRRLRKNSDYGKLKRSLLRLFRPDAKIKRYLYDFEFWNPGGLELTVREARKEINKVKPISARQINQPAMIFVNSVMLDEDIPLFMREWITKQRKMRHKPAYFDDTSHIQNLIFKVDGFGVSLSDDIYANINREYERIKNIYQPRFDLPPMPLNLAGLSYKAVISDLDGTLADTLQAVPKPIIEKILYLLSLGIQVAVITGQSYKEVEKYFLAEVPQSHKALLQNLTIYAATGSQGFGFDKNGNPLSRLLYNTAEVKLTDQQMSAWRKIITALLKEHALDKEVRDKSGRVAASPAKIIDAGSQIIVRLEERGFLRRELAKRLQAAIYKAQLPITLKEIGRTSIRMSIKGIDKSIAVKYHLTNVCKNKFGVELKPEEVLILGNSFDEEGDDREMMLKGAKVFSVGYEPLLHYLKGGINFYPAHGWKGADQLLAEFINLLSPELKDIPRPAPQEKAIPPIPIKQKDLNETAEYVRNNYPGIKIGVIGAALPTREYRPVIGIDLGRNLRKYVEESGFIFTGGAAGVGVDIYQGILQASLGKDDRFFTLLPEGMNPGYDYGSIASGRKIEVAHFGENMFERRIGMGKVADVLIVLNGREGTLHEAMSALENGKKVITLNYGGVGSMLYHAKVNGVVPTLLGKEGVKQEHLNNIIASDINNIEQTLASVSGLAPSKVPQRELDRFSAPIFSVDRENSVTLSQRAVYAINSLSKVHDNLTLDLDVATLIDTSATVPRLKGYGFKETLTLLDNIRQNNAITSKMRIRLVNINPNLDKEKIAKMLQLENGSFKELITIADIPQDYLVKGLDSYLVDGSIRIVFEDNLKYWGKAVDIVVKKGKENEVVSSLGLVLAGLAKDPEFYASLPRELKEYIVVITDDKGNALLDAEARIRQLIFMPIDRARVDARYLEQLERDNLKFETMA